MGVVFSSVKQAINFSEPEFHKKNIGFVYKTLININYPYEFIKNIRIGPNCIENQNLQLKQINEEAIDYT